MAIGALETLEERLNALEREMTQVKALLEQTVTERPQNTEPRWKGIVGVFKDCPEFEEAARLGREWRESQNIIEEELDAPA